ncbi:hypothetical protein [uncultured Lutibacter sp.]|nr:hypothetical protein [uncultured Lutibacter sp.]
MYHLDNKNINIVIIPYWLLRPSSKENAIKNFIKPRQLLIAHIPLK